MDLVARLVTPRAVSYIGLDWCPGQREDSHVTSKTSQDEALLTVVEVAGLLRIRPHTLYDWRWKRIGPPAIKVGGAVRYRRRDVEAWLDERQEPGAA